MPKEEKPYESRPKTLEEANAEIARLQAELASSGKGNIQKEPIAIIGMGCRYPGGVRTPEEFWHLLSSGEDILSDIPNDRWDFEAHFDPEITVPGKMYVRKGYYLDDIDQFDPQSQRGVSRVHRRAHLSYHRLCELDPPCIFHTAKLVPLYITTY